MEFPTTFAINKLVLSISPRFPDSPPYYEATPVVFEVSGSSATSWSGSGGGTTPVTKEQVLDAVVDGLKHMCAKLAEYSGREDVFLWENSVTVAFYGDASEATVIDLTPEEEPEE